MINTDCFCSKNESLRLLKYLPQIIPKVSTVHEHLINVLNRTFAGGGGFDGYQ